jgi:hypothetical protein
MVVLHTQGKRSVATALVVGLVWYVLSGRRWSDEGRLRRRLKDR